MVFTTFFHTWLVINLQSRSTESGQLKEATPHQAYHFIQSIGPSHDRDYVQRAAAVVVVCIKILSHL